MSNVTKKEETALAIADVMGEMAQDYGTQFNFRDIIIPRILLMQAMSKIVQADEAKNGDIYDTGSNKAIGSLREKDRKAVKFYPLQMFRYWVSYELTEDGLKYKQASPWTPDNADQPWDIIDGKGKKIGENQETVVFSVVTEDQLDNIEEPPRLLAFRKTSLRGAKNLKHHFLMCLSGKKEVPFQTAFELTGHQEKNDKGQFFVLDAVKRDKVDDKTLSKLLGFYSRYGKLIKEKIAGLVAEDEETPQSKTVEAEGGRAKF